MSGGDVTELSTRLQRWAEQHIDSSAVVDDVRAMPGHAGLSFGFRVMSAGGDELEHLIIRMPPKGVRRRGNTDVLRQVPLLKALRAAGRPVAEVAWWDADEQWFEVPYFMVRFLHGDTYQVREPSAAFTGVDCADLFRHAVEALATVHRLDHTVALADWEQPRDLADEVEFWSPLLDKAAEPEWRAMGEKARDLLRASLPTTPPTGLFHGDFQTNNILFEGDQVVAVLDWEISGIGAQLLDLGWLLFMNDPDCWADGGDALRNVPPFEHIVGWYAAAMGSDLSLDDVAFYWALSGYRFGVISGLNVVLHRTGKRNDPEWERIALSVPAMFASATRLLS